MQYVPMVPLVQIVAQLSCVATFLTCRMCLLPTARFRHPRHWVLWKASSTARPRPEGLGSHTPHSCSTHASNCAARHTQGNRQQPPTWTPNILLTSTSDLLSKWTVRSVHLQTSARNSSLSVSCLNHGCWRSGQSHFFCIVVPDMLQSASPRVAKKASKSVQRHQVSEPVYHVDVTALYSSCELWLCHQLLISLSQPLAG